MPVDLSAIPPLATRKPPPSLKRWLVVLLVFFICGGVITVWLWPVAQGIPERAFWYGFIVIPAVAWLFMASIRWFTWLVSLWLADGWDCEREKDMFMDIQRGQRFIILKAQCVHIPHAVTSCSLTEQFIIPQGVVLPVVVDEITHSVSHQSQFSDAGQAIFSRILRQMVLLLEDAALRAALLQYGVSRPLTVILQIDTDATLTPEEMQIIKTTMIPLLPSSTKVACILTFGLADIDAWLDKPAMFSSLLVISVMLRENISDGEGEAAVALLLCTANEINNAERKVAYIHRPERSKSSSDFNKSMTQALQWGKTTAEDIACLWLAGMGTDNKSQALLANNNLKFPRVDVNSQCIDIDMKSGVNGNVSPWLAIVLAAGNKGEYPFSQLLMSMPVDEPLPWWLIVHPVGEL